MNDKLATVSLRIQRWTIRCNWDIVATIFNYSISRRLSSDHAWFVPAAASVLCCLSTVACGKNEPAVFQFSIKAGYGAGYTDLTTWDLDVSNDGVVTQTTYGEPTTVRSRALSQQELAKLTLTIGQAGFFQLQDSYGELESDKDSLSLEISSPNLQKVVTVINPDAQEKVGEFRRFLQVWNLLGNYFPPPNKNSHLKVDR